MAGRLDMPVPRPRPRPRVVRFTRRLADDCAEPDPDIPTVLFVGFFFFFFRGADEDIGRPPLPVRAETAFFARLANPS